MATNDLMPLYYAIIKHFEDGKEDSAQGVVSALEPTYHGYKLLNVKDVEEALATAKENGLLDEVEYGLDAEGKLIISYAITDFGAEMLRKYLD